MSDFDEEAERRRLREKFDRDREKRQETARMSELLLKGATMTNQHCETCGDPIFRYRGQEFCPSCNAGGNVDATATEAAETNAVADASEADGAATGEPSASAADADATPEERPDASATDAADGASTARHPPSSQSAAPARGTGTPAPSRAPARANDAVGVDAAGGGEADLDAARASLLRTLTRHARRAEELDDPRRATEHLRAAREAAEALAAIDGAR